MDIFNAEHYPDPTAAEAIENVTKDERTKAFRPCVFICSPLAGDIQQNTEDARRYMRFAVDKGFIPFTPHLLYPQIMNEDDQNERQLALFFGRVWLSKCRELWVFGSSISRGMQSEIDKAERCCIPIRYFSENCEEV